MLVLIRLGNYYLFLSETNPLKINSASALLPQRIPHQMLPLTTSAERLKILSYQLKNKENLSLSTKKKNDLQKRKLKRKKLLLKLRKNWKKNKQGLLLKLKGSKKRSKQGSQLKLRKNKKLQYKNKLVKATNVTIEGGGIVQMDNTLQKQKSLLLDCNGRTVYYQINSIIIMCT